MLRFADHTTDGLMLALTGWFLVSSGRTIERLVELDALLDGIRVGAVMDHDVTGVPPGAPRPRARDSRRAAHGVWRRSAARSTGDDPSSRIRSAAPQRARRAAGRGCRRDDRDRHAARDHRGDPQSRPRSATHPVTDGLLSV